MKVGNITVNMHVTSTRPVYKDGWKGQERCSFNEVPYWALYKKVAGADSKYIGVFTLEDLNMYISKKSVEILKAGKIKYDAYSRWSKHTRGRNGKYEIHAIFTDDTPEYIKYNVYHSYRYARFLQAVDKCRKILKCYNEYIKQIYVTDNTSSVVVYIGK